MSTLTRHRSAYDQGRRLFNEGCHKQAAEQFRTWLKAHPMDARAHHDLSASLMAMGLLDEAEAACAAATEADPDFVKGWTSLATIQAARGQAGTPLKSMMRACRLDPESHYLRSRLGVMLLDHNHLEQAKRTFETIRRTAPDNLDAISGVAMVLERMGRLEEAHELMAPHIAHCPTHARAGLAWSAVCRRLGRPQDARPLLDRMLADPALTGGGRMMMLYEQGNLLERLGEFQGAWDAIAAANRLQPGTFDPSQLVEQTDRLIACFSAEALKRIPRGADPDHLPIFIVGVPRSGTSLVEQVLAAHPQVSAAGELSDLQAAAQASAKALGRPFPDCIEDFSADLARSLGAWYLQRRRASHPDALRVTDKMPQNFQILGLATAILPGATLIACERQPRDVAVSCYFQNFKAPLAWSYRLQWIRIYIDQQRRLMDHWESVLPSKIHRVRYEALVEDPQTECRALVSAAGLDWDPAVLSHHKSKRSVHTASYAQATQPIYRSSVDRSAEFSVQLDPFFANPGAV